MAHAGRAERVDRKAIFALVEALGSSLDIHVVLERAYPLLLRLVPADYGALGISSSGDPRDFRWLVAGIPSAFFAAYAEMAAHDFVRTAVARTPNVVLRDQEMVSRTSLEANPMYRRAREIGVPLEQVMAVMLHVDDRWQSGLSLYRDRRRPFTEHERRILQDVTPAFVNAVRSCHLFGAVTERLEALEALLPEEGAARLLVSPAATVVERTEAAARLIEKWFEPRQRARGQLPQPLAATLRQLQAAAPVVSPAPARWMARDGEETLEVSFVPLPIGARWLLILRETCRAVGLPVAWRVLLTPQQQRVTVAVLRGWDNRLIGSDLRCATATVKKHLQHIFDRLGVASRTALVARAAAESVRP